MRRYIQFAIFGIIFFTLFFLLNLFVIWSFADLFTVARGWLFWVLVFISTIIYPVTMVVDFVSHSRWIRAGTILGSIWMGVIVESCFVLLFYDLITQFIQVEKHLALTILLSCLLVLILYSLIASLFIRRKTIELHVPKLMHNLRVVQLSDLHLGSTYRLRYMKRVIHSVNSLNPDIVLITGDFADDISLYQKESLPIFNLFQAPVYMSLGNHEVYSNSNIKTLAAQININVLKNEALQNDGYQIIGIDDGYTPKEIGTILHQIPYDASKFTILLHHRPVGFEEASSAGVDLMLSGHTHHGQVFPFNFLVGLAWKRSRGLYTHGDSFLYVSPGTGTWGPPFRFGSFNEVTLFNLQRKTPSEDKN
jgi:uncharacterized protein